MQLLSYFLSLMTFSIFLPKSFPREGYILKRIGNVHWIVCTHHSFLISFLEQIKGATRDALLTKPLLRRHQYKKMGEFEIIHENAQETYLVKIYTYPHLFQKIKQFFKRTRGFNEFYTTYIAAIRGIPVEVPVAYGEQKHFFTKESYLIIRKIKNSCSIREYLTGSMILKEKRDVLKKFGELAKNVHESGIRQDAFSLDNFLVYDDNNGGKKVILIDFEMVSIQNDVLTHKLRTWYLAKLNREKGFSNTDRIRFLLSYTRGDFVRCKELATQIKVLTVRILKKDAKKSSRLCTHENRTFGIFTSDNFLGYYRKKYAPELLVACLNTIQETTRNVFYINNFQILRFKEHTGQGCNYHNVTRTWMAANALFALKINVPVPAGIFKRCNRTLQKEAFLISKIPDDCIPLSQCSDFYAEETYLFFLLRFAEQVSPFGIFSKDLCPQDILIQKDERHHLKCYLGNYTSFCINRRPVQNNKAINANIMKQLSQMHN